LAPAATTTADRCRTGNHARAAGFAGGPPPSHGKNPSRRARQRAAAPRWCARHRRKAARRRRAHPQGERTHRRGGLRRRRHPAPVSAITGSSCSEQRKGRKGETDLGLMGSRLPPGFDPARKPDSRPIEIDGQELLGCFRPRRVQAGRRFPSPGPGCGLGRGPHSARAGCGPRRRAGQVAPQVSRASQNFVAGPHVQKKIENFIHFRYISSILSLILLHQHDKFIKELMST
jgi:hypothetical protein